MRANPALAVLLISTLSACTNKLHVTLARESSSASLPPEPLAPEPLPPGPVPTITAAQSSPSSALTFNMTVTFDQSVTGFDLSDIIVNNGTKGNFSGSGTTYTFDITSPSNTVTVDIPANGALDVDGHGNKAATPFSITYAVPPAVNLVVGSVPAGLSSSPSISWSAASMLGVDHFEVRILNATDDSVVVNWQTLASGSALSSLTLDKYLQLYAEVRAVNASGQGSVAAVSERWIPDSDDCRGSRLTNSPYASGTGTDADPYNICTATQLNQIGLNTADFRKSFVQAAHIDLSAVAFNVIGNLTNAFSGRYLGQNRSIRNLTINVASGNYIGFFGYASWAYISNLSFVSPVISAPASDDVGIVAGNFDLGTGQNITIVNASITAKDGAGVFAGGVFLSEIFNCSLLGSVAGNNWIGGVVGYNNWFTIFNTTADVNVSGQNKVGGISGESYSIKLQNTQVQGSVTGNQYVSGLLGFSGTDKVYRSSFQGSVVGVSAVGGWIGETYDPVTIERSFADVALSGTDAVGGFVGNVNYITNIYDSYVKGSISDRGTSPAGDAGGMLGTAWLRTNIYRSYADVDISGAFAAAGGLMGEKDSYDSVLFQGLFTAGDVQGASATSSISRTSGIMPLAYLGGTDFYYWSGANCINSGGGGCGSDGNPVAGLSSFYDKTQAPLNTFDFTTVWQENAGAFPSLRMIQTVTPTVTQSCASTATVGVIYSCALTITDTDAGEIRAIKLLSSNTCRWIATDGAGFYAQMQPEAADIGTCTLSFVVTDGAHDSSVQTVTITVSL